MKEKEHSRRCIKCKASVADGPDITLHRFPLPKECNVERCERWAKFVFPHRRWKSQEFHKKLYTSHRMLCNRHFSSRSFCNKKLMKCSIPEEGVEPAKGPQATTSVQDSTPEKTQVETSKQSQTVTSNQSQTVTSKQLQTETSKQIQTDSFGDPLEVNQGYEVELQQAKAVAYSTDNDDDDESVVQQREPVAYSTDNDDDYQPSVSAVTSDDDCDEETTRRVTRRQATREATQSQIEVENGPCWCCLKQGNHTVADIPAILDCLNIPVLSGRQRPVVQLDNSIEEDENTTLRLEYVSETGKVQDMKVPLKDLYFDSSGHLVQYALEEESDGQESENDPKENKEVGHVERYKRPYPVQNAGANVKKQKTAENTNFSSGDKSKEVRQTPVVLLNKNFSLGDKSKEDVKVRQTPGVLLNKNFVLGDKSKEDIKARQTPVVLLNKNIDLNSSGLKISKPLLEVGQNTELTQNVHESHSVIANVPSNDDPTVEIKLEMVDGEFQATTRDINQSNVQPRKVSPVLVKKENVVTAQNIPQTNFGQAVELQIEQVDGQFLATASSVKQLNVQPIEVRKPMLQKDKNYQNIAYKVNVPQTNIGQTIELQIEEVDGQFVATTSNISDKVTLNEKTEVNSPPKTKKIPVLKKPVRRMAFPITIQYDPENS